MTDLGVELPAHLERRNARLFAIAVLVCYFPAPVIYVGVVQATLCTWLGASAAVANLPASLFALGGLAPLVTSWLVPFRRESSVTVWCFAIIALLMVLTGAMLLVPASSDLRLGAVILTSMLTGILSIINQVYLFQSLKRGTSEVGRARVLKVAYTAGPIVAVAGSLTAQTLLDSPHALLATPVNFALLYLMAAPCMLVGAIATHMMQLAPGEETKPVPLGPYLAEAATAFVRSRPLLFLCISYAAWNIGMSAMPTLSLYTRDAVGVAPESLAGYILALRFGCKSVFNFAYGAIAERFGTRWTLLAIQGTLLVAMLWAAGIGGFAYLGVFALLGASELGGVYFPNLCLSLSSPERGARNLSLLMVAQSVGGVAASAHGALVDQFGFSASLLLSVVCAVAAGLFIPYIRDGKNEVGA